MYALLLLCGYPDVGALDAREWADREAAHSRLERWGLLAVPDLLRAVKDHESPEVRYRAGQLLKPWNRLAYTIDAAAILLGTKTVPMQPLFGDDHMRRYLHLVARAGGCRGWCVNYLHPDTGIGWVNWWCELPPCVELMAAVEACRRQLKGEERGTDEGWPDR